MSASALLTLLVLGSEPAAEKPWALELDAGGLTVHARSRTGQRVKEVRAVGRIDGPPELVREILRDEAYVRSMPHVKEYRIVKDVSERHFVSYSRLVFPVIDDRDYFLDSNTESELAEDGSGSYRRSFKASGEARPTRAGIVRITVCEGFWEIAADADKTQSVATYYLLTDPGGWIPGWLADRANRSAVPSLFESLRAEVQKRKAARAVAAKK